MPRTVPSFVNVANQPNTGIKIRFRWIRAAVAFAVIVHDILEHGPPYPEGPIIHILVMDIYGRIHYDALV